MKKLLICFIALCLCLPACLAHGGVYRSLCVSVADYEDGRVRVGGLNSAQGMYDALSRAFGSEGSFISVLLANPDRDTLFDYIDLSFADASEDDVSLLYINAHGGAEGALCYLEMRDGAKLSPYELEERLRNIPGKIIVFIDACNSGGFIGASSSYSDLFIGAFAQNSFATDKYLVCASCLGDESSYRIASGEADEYSVSTVFARSVCEGLGWDLINDKSVALKADADRDRQVSFAELVSYVLRRGMYYLNGSNVYTQTVCATYSCPGFVLAARGNGY